MSEEIVVVTPIPSSTVVVNPPTGSTSASTVVDVNAASVGPQGPTGPTGPKGNYTVSETEPVNPIVGDTWFKSSTAQMYLRYDGYWVETSTSYLGPDQKAAKVLYVDTDGSDSNDGKSVGKAKRTIKAALDYLASLGLDGKDYTVFIKSGDYTEINPITIPEKVALVGDSLRTVTIRPQYPDRDIFYVSNGCYITEVTFRDHVQPVTPNADGSGGAAIAYKPHVGDLDLRPVIRQSPYVYNCSSITTTGTGMRIDGNQVLGGKSMLAAQYTQINQNGKGIHILNKGYAQLIGIYTICCDVGILCESGGFCSLIGSDTSFGNIGLKASGVSELLYTGTAPAVSVNATSVTITNIRNFDTNALQIPYANNVVSFEEPRSPDTRKFYTIKKIENASAGTAKLTFAERISTPVAASATAYFYQSSRITAAGHTFEYAGSGVNLTTALPQAGGIPNQELEIKEEYGGQVYRTSTDQLGDFRIGNDLVINRGTGDITGVAFDRSLFAVLTPYILALES